MFITPSISYGVNDIQIIDYIVLIIVRLITEKRTYADAYLTTHQIVNKN